MSIHENQDQGQYHKQNSRYLLKNEKKANYALRTFDFLCNCIVFIFSTLKDPTQRKNPKVFAKNKNFYEFL